MTTNTSEWEVTSSPALCILYSTILLPCNVIGLLGNLLVIAATFNKQGTFKLDLGTVIFLRHLALADVLTILMYPIPMTVVFMYQAWVFGDLLCNVIGHAITVPVFANINFILVISVHRYMRCRFPLKVHQLTPRRSTIMCGALWAFSCVFTVYTYAMSMSSEFNQVLATCTFPFQRSTMNAVMIILSTAVPFAIIVSTNVFLWFHVHTFTQRQEKRRKLKPEPEKPEPEQKRKTTLSRMKSFKRWTDAVAASNQGIITTTVVTALFAVTWLPTVVRFSYSAFAGELYVPVWLEQLRYVFFIGSWSNPIVYTLINKGFREYFRRFCSRLCRVYLVQPSRSFSSRVSAKLATLPEPGSLIPAVIRRISRESSGAKPEEEEEEAQAAHLKEDERDVELRVIAFSRNSSKYDLNVDKDVFEECEV